jgi:hypothetical protein
MDVMHTSVIRLFEQLGLPGTDAEISTFILKHRPLPESLELHEAPFWSHAQATLLCELKAQDAEWALAVDRLDLALR